MLPKEEPVVAREHNHRVLEDVQLLKGCHHPAKAFVHPNALERDILFKNFHTATSKAIDEAFKGVN